jgi:hypothetical protein
MSTKCLVFTDPEANDMEATLLLRTFLVTPDLSMDVVLSVEGSMSDLDK